MNLVKGALTDRRWVDEESIDELIENFDLKLWRYAQVENGLTKLRAFVQLEDKATLASIPPIISTTGKAHIRSCKYRYAKIVATCKSLRGPFGHEASNRSDRWLVRFQRAATKRRPQMVRVADTQLILGQRDNLSQQVIVPSGIRGRHTGLQGDRSYWHAAARNRVSSAGNRICASALPAPADCYVFNTSRTTYA